MVAAPDRVWEELGAFLGHDLGPSRFDEVSDRDRNKAGRLRLAAGGRLLALPRRPGAAGDRGGQAHPPAGPAPPGAPADRSHEPHAHRRRRRRRHRRRHDPRPRCDLPTRGRAARGAGRQAVGRVVGSRRAREPPRKHRRCHRRPSRARPPTEDPAPRGAEPPPGRRARGGGAGRRARPSGPSERGRGPRSGVRRRPPGGAGAAGGLARRRAVRSPHAGPQGTAPDRHVAGRRGARAWRVGGAGRGTGRSAERARARVAAHPRLPTRGLAAAAPALVAGDRPPVRRRGRAHRRARGRDAAARLRGPGLGDPQLPPARAVLRDRPGARLSRAPRRGGGARGGVARGLRRAPRAAEASRADPGGGGPPPGPGVPRPPGHRR